MVDVVLVAPPTPSVVAAVVVAAVVVAPVVVAPVVVVLVVAVVPPPPVVALADVASEPETVPPVTVFVALVVVIPPPKVPAPVVVTPVVNEVVDGAPVVGVPSDVASSPLQPVSMSAVKAQATVIRNISTRIVKEEQRPGRTREEHRRSTGPRKRANSRKESFP